MALKTYLLGMAATTALMATPGCFSSTFQEGLACSESGDCPGEQSCVAGACQLGGEGSLDSGLQPGPDATSVVQFDAAVLPPDATICEAGSQTFEFTGVVETIILPDCATSVHIEAFGAAGGGGRDALGGGGLGAKAAGDFSVGGGDTITVLVGGQGLDAVPGIEFLLEQGGGTGGGGSFVVDSVGSALIVAGGGGGATHTGGNVLHPGGPGQAIENGQPGGGDVPGAGGVGGAGGGTSPNTGFHSGTGGGGFTGSGVGSSTGNSSYGTPNQPGSSYAAGGAGGIPGNRGRNGAFGGGGSAGYTGGGGGGYSGGGSGDTDNAAHGGGGGGSFNAGSNPDNEPGVRAGAGQVTISYE